MNSHINFGYPWWLSYGHLVVAIFLLALMLLAFFRKWPKALIIVIGALTVWAAAASFISRFYLNVNGPLDLPTQAFLTSGRGRVLDMGVGTGRSTIMVLEARPNTSVVALDLFGESFKEHFGPEQSGQERLAANLKAAGLEKRATIQTADMRKLPFEDASFDGVVSTYAIDHLDRAGRKAALGEAFRVLKPGGDFLMMVVARDGWLKFTFGPLLLHMGMQSAAAWTSHLQDAGFHVMEQGSRPATLYFLARKP